MVTGKHSIRGNETALRTLCALSCGTYQRSRLPVHIALVHLDTTNKTPSSRTLGTVALLQLHRFPSYASCVFFSLCRICTTWVNCLINLTPTYTRVTCTFGRDIAFFRACFS